MDRDDLDRRRTHGMPDDPLMSDEEREIADRERNTRDEASIVGRRRDVLRDDVRRDEPIVVGRERRSMDDGRVILDDEAVVREDAPLVHDRERGLTEEERRIRDEEQLRREGVAIRENERIRDEEFPDERDKPGDILGIGDAPVTGTDHVAKQEGERALRDEPTSTHQANVGSRDVVSGEGNTTPSTGGSGSLRRGSGATGTDLGGKHS